MSDAITALDGARFEGAVTVEDAGLRGMITLRGDLASAAVKNAATGVTGVDMPGLRKAATRGDRGILWMSPDELLILCPYVETAQVAETMRAGLAGEHALVADVSDARALITLRGNGLREVLAKLAPVDMSPAAFAPGDLRRTRLAQVAGAFWLVSEREAQVICFRSVARYVFGLLANAAEFDARLEHFDSPQTR